MSHPFAESARTEQPRRRRYKRPHPANEDRRRTAAARQSQRAQAALDVLSARDVAAKTVWRKRWREVLELRASDSEASLAQLAASMSPPMTKSAFSCQLDRAINAAGVDDDTDGPSEQEAPPAAATQSRVSESNSVDAQHHTAGCPSAFGAELSAMGGRR